MHPLIRLSLLVVTMALAACQKSADQPAASAAAASGKPAAAATVGLVEGGGRSAHFAAVNRHLELGGTLYGYVDVDGDVLKLAGELQKFIGELGKTEPAAGLVARQNLAEIATLIGLTDVKAMGASSVAEDDGYYRNRLFLYTGGERRGLLAALGGKPGPFRHLPLAPADTAFYAEAEMDLGVAYRTIKDVVTKVAGEPVGSQIEATLRRAGESAALSLLDLIYGLKGRTAVMLRVEPEKTLRLPGPNGLVIPAFSAVVAIEGIGQIVEPALARSRDLKRSESGTARIFEPVRPTGVAGLQPAILVDGTTLYAATSLAFLGECRAASSGLAKTPEFQQALAKLGAEGNGLTYVSPRLFARAKDIEQLNPNLPPRDKSVLAFLLQQLPQSDRPLVAIRTNLDDGILVRSSLNRSMKQDVVALSIYNPVTVGLMAAMAIPAFQKTRDAAQEKAVLNNLRMLTAAADQHYLENGVTSATYDQLVGPTRYIKTLQPVAGENYRALRFQQGQPLRVRLQNGKVIQYPTR